MRTENSISPFFLPEDQINTDKKIVIIAAEWNHEITRALAKDACEKLISLGLLASQIVEIIVPGSFELPLAAKWATENEDVAGVICFGCVIKGESAHFEYVCEAATKGILDVSLASGKPVIYGLLTVFTQKQAEERTFGPIGKKGEECAVTLAKMLSNKSDLEIGKK